MSADTDPEAPRVTALSPNTDGGAMDVAIERWHNSLRCIEMIGLREAVEYIVKTGTAAILSFDGNRVPTALSL
mgnify:CR=1 FL=1